MHPTAAPMHPEDAVLRELDHVQQDAGPHHRRWFASDTLELIVWTGDDGAVESFQLCATGGADEWGVGWRRGERLGFFGVDTGEGRPFSYKASPVLIPAPARDLTGLVQEFQAQGGGLEDRVRAAVL